MSLEHFDVLIVGAGLSGVGGACHLTINCPGKTYAVLEARERMGGTWDLFRYPGVRSDSDMFTLGYSFRPWTDSKAIADGPAILKYVNDTARDYGVDRNIRYGHRVVRASWSGTEGAWTVEAERGASKELVRFTCSFFYMCAGYYNYEEGYSPEFAGSERFEGRIVHPQKWTDDVDYAGKRVVVIGSGATAVTLVPAMTDKAAHVTMLQRSPTYIVTLPSQDVIANFARRWLPAKLAYAIARWKNVLHAMLFYWIARRIPRLFKALVRMGIKAEMGKDYSIKPHFTPYYEPWDQRLCLVPDADLFKVLREGRASIVTDQIDTFTEKGIRLKSGAEIQADLVITATGLNMLLIGGTQLAVDGAPVNLPKTLSYRGMMISDVPNMAFAVGYTNASWTLKCDLVAQYVCRLINYMDRHDYRQCVPRRTDPSITEQPIIDFSSGYVQRSIADFPKAGSKVPWRLHQNYARDLLNLRFGSLDDGVMEFASRQRAVME